MLKQFGKTTKRISPILDLMKQETGNVLDAISSNDFTQLGNTVERLGLLTSRLYSEYLSSQNQFSENPDLLNEALRVLTASQEATMEAQNLLNKSRAEQLNAKKTAMGDPSNASGSTNQEPVESALVTWERRITLFSAIGIPAYMFYASKDLGYIKQPIVKGLAIISGLVSLRYYMKQYPTK